MEPDNSEMLKARLRELEEEKKAIENLLGIWEGRKIAEKLPPKVTAASYSTRGRVVDAIIELIHTLGKQVGNKEILSYLEERGISLGDTKNKQAMLAAMLSQEIRKKSARLRKIARGVYDLKQ